MFKKFSFKFGENYSRKSYKNTFFSDFPKTIERIDFTRSDFRGSQFQGIDCTADFDRADFMSCSFKNINFTGTNFGAPQFKNCIFENVNFTRNTYNATVFIKCSFINCKFENENVYTNITDCFFNNVDFKNMNFERSTIDNSQFFKCNFLCVDFSSLAAEDLTFESVHFHKVTMSINYFFSYFIDSMTNLEEIKFEYRGNTTYLNEELADNYFNTLSEEGRYSELFNMCVLCANESILEEILRQLLLKKEMSSHQLQRCIECIIFYFKKGMLSFETSSTLLNILKSSIQGFDIDNLIIGEKVFSLERLLTTLPIDKIKTLNDKDQEFNLIFRCSIDSENEAVRYIEKLLTEVSLATKNDITEPFKLIEKKRGSWILTYLVPAILVISIIKQIQGIIANNQVLKKNQLQIRFIESYVNDSLLKLKHNQSIELKSQKPIKLRNNEKFVMKIFNSTELVQINNSDLIDKITNIDISKIQ